MLKIAYLTSVHPSLDVRIFHKECRTLSAEGYNVILVAQHDRDEEVGGVQIRRLPRPKNRFERMSRTVWQVWRAALKEGANLHHFHDPDLMPIGLLLKLMKKKVIYDVHEDYPKSLLNSDRTWIPSWGRPMISCFVSYCEWLGALCFDGVVAATPAIAKRFPPSKTVTVQNYPILNELMTHNPVPYQERQNLVIYVGIISLLRGIKEMVHAMEILPEKLKCQLILAGKFDSSAVETKIRMKTGWKSVNFLGWKSRNEIATLLGTVKTGLVLFHPVYNHIEAQPNKLFEYMSAGIPVIASNFPLWQEIINETGCGLLVDPLDYAAIANAIQWLLEHPEEAEVMGKNGQEAVKKKYNWDNEAKKLLALYQKILS